MLQILEAVAVICHAYLDRVTDQGKNLVWDRFYHGLMPSLQDALGFAMANMLLKKMEVRQPSHPPRIRSGSSDAYRDKYRRYPAPVGWVAMLAEEELLPPDPEPPDSEVSEPDVIKGLSLRMTQVMNHYQWEEHHCFMCGTTDYFARDCPHWLAFCAWHKEHLNSKGVGPQEKVPAPKSPPSTEVSMQIATACNNMPW